MRGSYEGDEREVRGLKGLIGDSLWTAARTAVLMRCNWVFMTFFSTCNWQNYRFLTAF